MPGAITGFIAPVTKLGKVAAAVASVAIIIVTIYSVSRKWVTEEHHMPIILESKMHIEVILERPTGDTGT